MPLYEYHCPACGRRFEKLCRTSGTETEEQRCPDCGRPAARSIPSRVATVRGTGGSSASNCGTSGSGFS